MKQLCLTVLIGFVLSINFACAQNPKTDVQKPKTDETPSLKNQLYSQMSDDEKNSFVAAKSDAVLSLFGRVKGDEISAEGLKIIKNYLDGYAARLSGPKFDSCSSRDWIRSDLTSVLMRGGKNAAVIREEFTAQKLPPELGIYVAMIETEFCPCLQSPIGGLGMYQWTSTSGTEYGLKTVKGASPAKPDERCQPQLAARAAAKYFKKMVGDIFGSDAVGFPLSISAFNRGEGMTKKHLADVSAFSKAPRISFWGLIETQEELIKKLEKDAAENTAKNAKLPVYIEQFQSENIKYVPKFFAAAIIGENPTAFGLKMPPLSQTK